MAGLYAPLQSPPPPSSTPSQPWAIFSAAAVATVVFSAFTANVPADAYPTTNHQTLAAIRQIVPASTVNQPRLAYSVPSTLRVDAEDYSPQRARPYPFGSVASVVQPQPWWLWPRARAQDQQIDDTPRSSSALHLYRVGYQTVGQPYFLGWRSAVPSITDDAWPHYDLTGNLHLYRVGYQTVGQPRIALTTPALPRLDAEDYSPQRVRPYPFGTVVPIAYQPYFLLWLKSQRVDPADEFWLTKDRIRDFYAFVHGPQGPTYWTPNQYMPVLHPRIDDDTGFPRQPDRTWPSVLLTRIAPVFPSHPNTSRFGTSPWLIPTWQDESSIHSWQLKHDIRHRTLRKAATLSGMTITTVAFGGTLDESWFRRHTMAHLALEHIKPIGHAQSANGLGTKGWDDEHSFYEWHHKHALIHARLDQLYGTVS